MKRIILLSAFVIGMFAANAQTTRTVVVNSPSSSLQSFDYAYATGYDSTSIASATMVTIPAGYYTFNQQLYQASGKAWKDSITLPTNPIAGQTVNIYCNVGIYHLFKTVPDNVLVDSAGGANTSTLEYDGTLKKWKMVR